MTIDPCKIIDSIQGKPGPPWEQEVASPCTKGRSIAKNYGLIVTRRMAPDR